MLNNNNEIWKPVPNFERLYWVSSLGKVRNKKGLILKTHKINSGYEGIKLYNKGNVKHFLIHRLVLQAFEPNTDISLTEVNHIDENKYNNTLTNLEWVTSSQNKQHSIKSGRYDKMLNQKITLGKKHKSDVSKYYNVGYDKNRSKWVACIRDNGKTYEWRRFDTEIEAALHINYLIDKYGFTNRPKNIIV